MYSALIGHVSARNLTLCLVLMPQNDVVYLLVITNKLHSPVYVLRIG